MAISNAARLVLSAGVLVFDFFSLGRTVAPRAGPDDMRPQRALSCTPTAVGGGGSSRGRVGGGATAATRQPLCSSISSRHTPPMAHCSPVVGGIERCKRCDMGAGAEQAAQRDGVGSAPHGGGSGESTCNGTKMSSAASTLRLATCLPRAMERFEAILRGGRRLVLFLDYDGTLSPIVDDPDQAFLPEATRQALRAVASMYTTAIVTGRSMNKIRSFVQLSNVVYAGSHGFDIGGKLGDIGDISHRVAFEHRPSLEAAKTEMEERLGQFNGASVEDNTLSVSFHYRKCEGDQVEAIERFVKGVAKQHGLALTRGKMVFELRPRVAWNKGKAVEYLLKAMKLDGEDVLPVYVGDDLTDEDAFKVLRGRGVSVIVADTHSTRLTVADLRVNDPSEVRQLLLYFARRQQHKCAT